jgi:hypothetical protein
LRKGFAVRLKIVSPKASKRPPIGVALWDGALHVLAADGAFLPDGRLVALPSVPGDLLAEGFRRAVLDFLVENGALSEELRARMLAWQHGGLSVHNEVSGAAEDAEGRKSLAGYMLRAPMSLENMRYDALTGTVIDRVGEPPNEFMARAKAAQARLIRKVYETVPLE